MRKYEDYYISKKINTTVQVGENTAQGESVIYYGIRLQDTFLSKVSLYRILGFKTLPEIMRDWTPDKPKPVVSKISNFSDAARQGLVQEVQFTLIPQEKSSQIFPYNEGYKTSVPYCLSKNIQDLCTVLYSLQFELGDAKNSAVYVIGPLTLLEKRRKKTAPRF